MNLYLNYNKSAEQIKDNLENKINSTMYMTFITYWIIFHWEFIYSLIFLDDQKIFLKTGLLKNEYLVSKFFNLDLSFWFFFFVPFILTYLTIFIFEQHIFFHFYKKNRENRDKEKEYDLFRSIGIETLKGTLESKKADTVTKIAERTEKQKIIEQNDPEISWEQDYIKFKELNYIFKYLSFTSKFFSGRNNLFDFDSSDTAYFDSLGLIDIEQGQIISITEKGKFFIKKSTEDQHDIF